jgi:phosphoribosylglycinamide formyltransferase-1
MRILSDTFVRRYPGRLLNIHPSLLPKYTGLNTHQRAIEAGEREHGATVHFVTEELDGGPSVCQALLQIQPGEQATQLAARVLAREHLIYPLVLAWYAQGRLQMVPGHVLLDGQPLLAPIRFDYR